MAKHSNKRNMVRLIRQCRLTERRRCMEDFLGTYLAPPAKIELWQATYSFNAQITLDGIPAQTVSDAKDLVTTELAPRLFLAPRLRRKG
jgi:hypothetical protein